MNGHDVSSVDALRESRQPSSRNVCIARLPREGARLVGTLGVIGFILTAGVGESKAQGISNTFYLDHAADAGEFGRFVEGTDQPETSFRVGRVSTIIAFGQDCSWPSWSPWPVAAATIRFRHRPADQAGGVPATGTPAGTSTVTVTATSGSGNSGVPVTLTVTR